MQLFFSFQPCQSHPCLRKRGDLRIFGSSPGRTGVGDGVFAARGRVRVGWRFCRNVCAVHPPLRRSEPARRQDICGANRNVRYAGQTGLVQTRLLLTQQFLAPAAASFRWCSEFCRTGPPRCQIRQISIRQFAAVGFDNRVAELCCRWTRARFQKFSGGETASVAPLNSKPRGQPQSGNGMNSCRSSIGRSKRPLPQRASRHSSFADSIFSRLDATKFHQTWRGPFSVAPPSAIMRAP